MEHLDLEKTSSDNSNNSKNQNKYANKLENYQADCDILLGKYKYKRFSDFIQEFSKTVIGKGLELELVLKDRMVSSLNIVN